MATPSEKLAQSLDVLRDLQERGRGAVRSRDLSRTHRERLEERGFLRQVMKGWYIPCWPDEPAGESTAWYAAFWVFCAAYLRERFGEEWSLSPEQSLILHAGNHRVPGQLLVRSPKARNKVTPLPHGTSLLDVKAALPEPGETETFDGLRLFSLPAALIACAPGYYKQNPTDIRTGLSMVLDASELLERLLEGGHSTIAGRLAGAFRNIGRDRIAEDILETMRTAGYDVREKDPFAARSPTLFGGRQRSPYVNRLRLMWEAMRGPVLKHFPAAPGLVKDTEDYLRQVVDAYVSDAYHSLSIEGYRVSPALIERVRAGAWNPDNDAQDRKQRDAMAARGYWQAHQAVQNSVQRVLEGEPPGLVADEDHGTWYRELFGPSVTAGLSRPGDLAGYRNGPVYIRGAMHVPPMSEAVRELMPAFFGLLKEEEDPGVRAVLGHFVFVYIHPYMDGNGRIGRFMMNVMLAAGGYPWTVIPVDRREIYMEALERASAHQDIEPFCEFLGKLVKAGLAGKPSPAVPSSQPSA